MVYAVPLPFFTALRVVVSNSHGTTLCIDKFIVPSPFLSVICVRFMYFIEIVPASHVCS